MANSNGTSRLSREPQSIPAGGDGAPSQGAPSSRRPSGRALDYLTEGTRPRTVTAETAYRCRLWERGTLLHEDPFGCLRVRQIYGDYSALTDPNNPEFEPEALELFPGATLTFVPSSS